MSDYDNNYGPTGPIPPDHRRIPPQVSRTRTSGMAIASVLFGIMGFGLWILTGIPAIIMSILARREIRRNPDVSGRGWADLGLGLGLASFFIAPFVFIVMLQFLLFLPIGSIEIVDMEEKNRIPHFHLSGLMPESPQGDPTGMLGGLPGSLTDVLSRMNKASKDDDVRAVILTLDNVRMGYAHREELRNAIKALTDANKKVFAHSDGLMTGDYLLLSSASHLNVVPTASIFLTGFYGEGMYLKDAMEKIGVKADMVNMGEYKSAGELMTRTGPSEKAEENMNWLFDSLYDSCVDMISESRGLTGDVVRNLIDDGLYTSESAQKAGLIDSTMYIDEFLDFVKREHGENIPIDNYYAQTMVTGIDLNNPLAPLIIMMAMSQPVPTYDEDAIGVIYLDGMILPGYGVPSPFGGSRYAYSGDIGKALDEAAKDDSIKAVVLRVNSPGGSATASEIILRAATKLGEKKPLIVSMGNVAGSGGYYVACNADTIFVDETTITASIGVIGGKVVTDGLWDKLGVNWHSYKRGKNADILSAIHSFDDDQRKRISDFIEETYVTFKERVVEGRGDKLKKGIDELAGGRVFTGKQAIELGLVDKIGGLNDAIEYAVKKVSLEERAVRVIPAPKDMAQLMFESFFGSQERSSDLEFPKKNAGLLVKEYLSGTEANTQVTAMIEKLDPQHMQIAIQAFDAASLIHNEAVIMMMPQLIAFE